jgi:hypothetical protein
MIHNSIHRCTLSSQCHLVFRRDAETTTLVVAVAVATAVVAVVKGAGGTDAVLAVVTVTLAVVVAEVMTVAEAVVPTLPVPAEVKTSTVLFATCGEPQNQSYVVSTANLRWFVLRNLARPTLWCG